MGCNRLSPEGTKLNCAAVYIKEKQNDSKNSNHFFFSYFIYSSVFLSVAYLTVANLAQLGIWVSF